MRIVYDADTLPLQKLLDAYFKVIDPTAVNRQGEDEGIQYRTGIYRICDEDAPVIDAALADLARSYRKHIAVENQLLQCCYPAEDYHQKYIEKNPGGYCHIKF